MCSDLAVALGLDIPISLVGDVEGQWMYLLGYTAAMRQRLQTYDDARKQLARQMLMERVQ